jgi:hypothetical protein
MTEKGNYEIRHADKLRNCEDLVVDEKVGYVVLGCDEGRDVWNTVMVRFSHSHLFGVYSYSVARASLVNRHLQMEHYTSTTTPALAHPWKPYASSTHPQTTLSTL